MKQKFLDNQIVESGINRYSEKYNIGRDVRYIGDKNLLGKIAGYTLIGIGLVGLMFLTGDKEPVEKPGTYQTSKIQQPDLNNLNVWYEKK